MLSKQTFNILIIVLLLIASLWVTFYLLSFLNAQEQRISLFNTSAFISQETLDVIDCKIDDLVNIGDVKELWVGNEAIRLLFYVTVGLLLTLIAYLIGNIVYLKRIILEFS